MTDRCGHGGGSAGRSKGVDHRIGAGPVSRGRDPSLVSLAGGGPNSSGFSAILRYESTDIHRKLKKGSIRVLTHVQQHMPQHHAPTSFKTINNQCIKYFPGAKKR